MKIKSIFVSMLAVLALTACSKEPATSTSGGADIKTAYLTVQVAPQIKSTRTSDENVGTAGESKINNLYILTFNDQREVIKHYQAALPYIHIGEAGLTVGATSTTTNDAFKVSPSVKYVLMVANPGTQMLARLNSVVVGTTYADFNAMITANVPIAGTAELGDAMVKEVYIADDNFTMISAGDVLATDCLTDVSGNIVEVTETVPDATAIADAKSNAAKLTIERLAAKVEVTVGTLTITGANAGSGLFAFLGWEFDHRNSKFFPYAYKNSSAEGHTPNPSPGTYTNNFYTIDPNYGATNYTDGIIKNELVDRKPNFTWNAPATFDYAIENTMEAASQKHGGTTLLIIKSQYSPMTTWTLGADWFSFGTTIYENLAAVQTAYAAADATAALKTACETFLTQVNTELSPIVATFGDLTQADLDGISDGGELCKTNDCLLWYDGGVNYYYYRVRHDYSSDADMYFGKYGVVRNNWYKLNLTSVSGKGTPWYPGGGPEDPGDSDDNDEGTARLAFEITVGPWIYWTNDFGI